VNTFLLIFSLTFINPEYTFEYVLSAIMALIILGYLVYALIFPEKL